MSDKLLIFLNENNIVFQDQSSSVILTCPACSKNKLYIHKEELNFICFSCAATDDNMKGPSASKVLEMITGTPAYAIRSKLSDFVPLSKFTVNFDTNVVAPAPAASVFEFPPNVYRITTNAALPGLHYLESRGITREVAANLDIRYNVNHKSVIFPIYNEGKIIGYQGRSIDPDCPKQFQKITMKGLQKSRYLMFEQTIKSNKVILAEGPVSAMKFSKSNIGFVATMGKYVSSEQLSLLKKLGVDLIYLALDEDAYAETEALMTKHSTDFEFKLVRLTKAAKVRLKDNKKPDFGDCTPEECNDALAEAIPFNRMTAFTVKTMKNKK